VGNLFKQPDALAKIATHPKTAAYLQQPDFVSMLTEVQRTPASFSKYMNDPRMMQVLGVLLGVDIRSGHAEGDTRDTAATGPKAPPRAPEPVPEVEMTDAEKAEKEAKAAAVKEKELGNDCYKAKKFDDAIAHYNKAIELDPTVRVRET
jgi:stress-induced-phosphoprotein 1